jgi:aurora kinase
MADVANLEAAFERTTINDENDDQVSSTTTTTTTYHKAKVCFTRLSIYDDI